MLNIFAGRVVLQRSLAQCWRVCKLRQDKSNGVAAVWSAHYYLISRWDCTGCDGTARGALEPLPAPRASYDMLFSVPAPTSRFFDHGYRTHSATHSMSRPERREGVMIGVCPAIETAAARVAFLWRVEGRADTLARQFPDAASESRRAVDLASGAVWRRHGFGSPRRILPRGDRLCGREGRQAILPA